MKYLSTLIILLALVSTSQAGYKEMFEKEFMLSPWAGANFEDSSCITCHNSDNFDPELRKITDEWRNSWHSQNHVSCHNCHGGDPEDQSRAMSHDRGFQGVPVREDIADECGKCHIAILQNFMKSGHGNPFCDADSVPTCVTCHGAHDIQQANIDIINEQRCSQCHSYERAKEMRQALLVVENKLTATKKRFDHYKSTGVLVDDLEKSFFRTHSEFRALFHTVDVNLVKEKTSTYLEKIEGIDSKLDVIESDLKFRGNFTSLLFLLFLAMGAVLLLLAKTYNNDEQE